MCMVLLIRHLPPDGGRMRPGFRGRLLERGRVLDRLDDVQ